MSLPTEIFHRCFPHEPHHWDGFLSDVERQLPESGRLLDLGCGANLTLAAYRSSQREVWGTDFQIHPHLQHREWFRQLGHDGRIPFVDASFDLIAASWVLEHVTKPGIFLAEVKRVLRPGGMFLAHTINGNHYVALIRRLVGIFSHELSQKLVTFLYGRPYFDTHPAYYRLNTHDAISRSCRHAGLELLGVRRYADPFYFQFCKPLLNAAIGLDWLLERWRPGYGRIYLTVSMRKPIVKAHVECRGTMSSQAA